jgi:dihydrofolate synthase / folylpolyglutamate synthase
VAMAFEYFSEKNVDIAIIETGLGGRLDSTNIITPVLSVITNIGYDHMNILGDSLEKIAIEKAGIIKKKVPVIIGEAGSETLHVFEKAASEKNSALVVASKELQVMNWSVEKNMLHAEVAFPGLTDHKKFQLDLAGIYQLKNLLPVLEACRWLQSTGWEISEQDIQEGLKAVRKTTGLHGRWEVLHRSPMLVADVAHNPDGIKQLLEQVEITDHKSLHIILGLVKDKDTDGVLSLLPKHANYYFTNAAIPRALPAEELQKKAARHGLKGKTFSNIHVALYGAALHASKEDLILVCGSIFLIGELNLSSVKAIWGSGKTIGNTDFLEMIPFFD